MSADALEYVAQVGERVDAESLAGGDEASQRSRCPPAVVASEKEPVLASDRDPTQKPCRRKSAAITVELA